MLWRFLIVAVLALAIAGAAACGDDDEEVGDDDGAATTVPAAGETEPPDETDAPTDGEEVLVPVIAEGFAFDTTIIAAEPGDTVTVAYTNNDSTSHTFTIDELDVDLSLAGGASEEVTFTMPDSAIEFYCRFHPSSMQGTLEPGGEPAGSGGGGNGASTRY